MKYYIWTVGCQMNKADSERFARALEALGCGETSEENEADLIVLNSCSVRRSAEQRVLGKLGMLKALKRRNPALRVVLAGCMVDGDGADLRRNLPQIDAAVPAGDAAALTAAVVEMLGADGFHGDSGPAGLRSASRADVCRWLPVIQGCDNFCSYCVVPYRRGREQSRPVSEVLAEAQSLVAEGAREVTLLGQNIAAYGRDLAERPTLALLLEGLDGLPGLRRIRFLTCHPRDVDDVLIDAVARLPKVCEHLNLPVQHGDDAILHSMGRGYTADQYRQLVGRIRQRIPEIGLATDVIVGFPNESEQQFETTVALLRDIAFDTVHVAMYSPRPGTVAAQWADDVPLVEKKRRLATVEATQEAIALQRHGRLVGSGVEVLVEGEHKGKWQGRTRGNKLVFLPMLAELLGQVVEVDITSATAWSLQGSPVGVVDGGRCLEVAPVCT